MATSTKKKAVPKRAVKARATQSSSSTKKPSVVHKTAARKPAAKKPAARKRAAKKLPRVPSGYVESDGGILTPGGGDVTPPSKLRAGLSSARKEIAKTLNEIVSVMTQDFEIAEIEVSASFSADGKFLGFGVGGATTIKVKIKPSEADA